MVEGNSREQRTVVISEEEREALAALSDEEFIAVVNRAPWRTSKGYLRPDGLPVGAHQYLIWHEAPAVANELRRRIRTHPDRYTGTYQGPFVYTYLNLGGFKYWAMKISMVNREKLPDSDPDDAKENTTRG